MSSADADHAWLRRQNRPPHLLGDSVTVVDLFAGCGGLSLGLSEACRAVGKTFSCRLAVEIDQAAADVFRVNFPSSRVTVDDITAVFDRSTGRSMSAVERNVRRTVGSPAFLVGGPPCQGHSDLNNRTRRFDSKNSLYLSMVRAAEVLEPETVIIENVPGALNDRNGVVQRAIESLVGLGYDVETQVVDCSELGVPQGRRRLVLLATSRSFDMSRALMDHRTKPRSVRWAISDLLRKKSFTLLDEPATSAPATRKRIDYLFEHGLYELPDTQRPPCHSGGSHSYGSIYGRLSWDRPAQTVTTGFYSMCMGRYVHPTERRTITAHEAARLQFFPDWFDFTAATRRGQLATMIGNAVPSRLSYVLALELLR